MKKILYVAAKVKLHINLFHIPFLVRMKKEGYEVHVAARNDYEEKGKCRIEGCDCFYDIPFRRIPLNPDNIKAYTELKKIISENNYDIVHCHTPIGSALARLASRNARKKGTKVIYTAHGFHFYRGAPMLNGILYHIAERLLARMTDVIITINEEDTLSARKFRNVRVIKMNGVGIDIQQFSNNLKQQSNHIKSDLNIPGDARIMFFAGELSYRKHQDFLIELMGNYQHMSDVHLILAGEGSYMARYKRKTDELHLNNKIHFLGFRHDIVELMKASDICVSSSRQEGLPVNIMEAMAVGLPVVCFNVRGNNDLIEDKKGGYLIPLDDMDDFSQKLKILLEDENLRRKMGEFNRMKIKSYDKEQIVEEMIKLYDGILKENQ